jgi:hypothetical protein
LYNKVISGIERTGNDQVGYIRGVNGDIMFRQPNGELDNNPIPYWEDLNDALQVRIITPENEKILF